MENNHTLRSLRFLVDLNEGGVEKVLQSAGYTLDAAAIGQMLLREEEPGFVACPDEVLSYFLAGLITLRRGVDDKHPPRPVERRITNNLVLKKLRVAFELKEDDLHAIMRDAGFPISKPELSALFRQEGQKNYRPCGDQILRNFLKGLTMRLRPSA